MSDFQLARHDRGAYQKVKHVYSEVRSKIYCPGHARVSGNEWADRLASTADITSRVPDQNGVSLLYIMLEIHHSGREPSTSGLQLGRAEVLRGLRNFLKTDRPEHHSIERLKKRSGERKPLTFHPPRSRTICVQPDKHWHYFKGNLG